MGWSSSQLLRIDAPLTSKRTPKQENSNVPWADDCKIMY
jgi:hypothetical protein